MPIIKPTMTTKVVDHGYEKALKNLLSLDGAVVTWGFHEDAGEYPDGVPVATVAYKNEMGSPGENIPERSFLREAIDKNKKGIEKFIVEQIEYLKADKISKGELLDDLGEELVDDVRKAIDDKDTPPNAPATIAKKGRNDPLSDTGTMRRLVSHRNKG